MRLLSSYLASIAASLRFLSRPASPLPPSMPRIPDLPGNLIPHNSDQERWLKHHVAVLCRLDNERCVAHRYLSPANSPNGLVHKIPRESTSELRGERLGQAGGPRVRSYCHPCPCSLRNTYLYRSYWVAEKSDGVRVLLLVHTDTMTTDQMVYLVSSPSVCCAL